MLLLQGRLFRLFGSAAFLFALLGCSAGTAAAQDLALLNRKGKTLHLSASTEARYVVVLTDSAVADSTWPVLLRAEDLMALDDFSATDYRWVDTIDLATERIAFRLFAEDTTRLWIPISDIHGLIPKPGLGGKLIHSGSSFFSSLFFFTGAFGLVWGLAALVDQGTPVDEDMLMIGGSLGSFAFFAGFVVAGKAWQNGHLYRFGQRP